MNLQKNELSSFCVVGCCEQTVFVSRCHTFFERQGMKGLLCYIVIQAGPNTMPDKRLMVTCYRTKLHMDGQIVVCLCLCLSVALRTPACSADGENGA